MSDGKFLLSLVSISSSSRVRLQGALGAAPAATHGGQENNNLQRTLRDLLSGLASQESGGGAPHSERHSRLFGFGHVTVSESPINRYTALYLFQFLVSSAADEPFFFVGDGDPVGAYGRCRGGGNKRRTSAERQVGSHARTPLSQTRPAVRAAPTTLSKLSNRAAEETRAGAGEGRINW